MPVCPPSLPRVHPRPPWKWSFRDLLPAMDDDLELQKVSTNSKTSMTSTSTSIFSSNSRSLLSSTRSWLSGGSEGRSSVLEDKIGPLGLNTLSVPTSNPANIDLIFVHGLGGGSRKTWTKSGDPTLYWPKEWLPSDEALKDVRIHSFGYDSNWGKKSILSIHDFADALLNAILDCPSIPRDTKAC